MSTSASSGEVGKNERLRAPSTLGVVRAVGWVTLLDIIRDKVLYNFILFAALLFGVGYLASRLTAVSPERVVLDFGLSSVMLSCSVIAIFTGSGLLAKEFERRTIQVALSRPISKGQFVLGKFVGLSAVIGLNWLLLVSSYLIILALSSAHLDTFTPVLCAALLLIFLQALVVAGISIVFSTFSTTSLTVMCTSGLYLIGTNITQLRLLAARSESPTSRVLLKIIAAALPNLEYFNLGTKVTYGLPVTNAFLGVSLLYGLVLIVLLLLISGILIHTREV
jgi:ABC-type transport system involved in multi-copper enzyme maturation permease subunit